MHCCNVSVNERMLLQVPALNLSSVGRESPTKSPSRALQPAEFDSNNSTALVFKQPKKVRSIAELQHVKVSTHGHVA